MAQRHGTARTGIQEKKNMEKVMYHQDAGWMCDVFATFLDSTRYIMVLIESVKTTTHMSLTKLFNGLKE